MSDEAACDGCDGTGKVPHRVGMHARRGLTEDCPHCRGTGRVDVRDGK